MRKPVFGVSDQVRHKPSCTTTEDSKKLEILVLGRRGIVLSVAKTKALISCAFFRTADLRGYRTADLRLCFCICKKPVFSQRGSFESSQVRFPAPAYSFSSCIVCYW